MQNHRRDKVYPLTVEAKVERLVLALAKIKEMEDKLDAVMAHVERLRAMRQFLSSKKPRRLRRRSHE